MGTSVSASGSDARMANEIVRISSWKISADSPVMSRNGATAARLVVVDATTALVTSLEPTCAAISGSSPSASRCR
ncbi:hypothetical protein D3C83_47400 [compost metagenome]